MIAQNERMLAAIANRQRELDGGGREESMGSFGVLLVHLWCDCVVNVPDVSVQVLLVSPSPASSLLCVGEHGLYMRFVVFVSGVEETRLYFHPRSFLYLSSLVSFTNIFYMLIDQAPAFVRVSLFKMRMCLTWN